ncbi:unnamed protein product [Cladocopium goreaui]|uniref:Uncharacterized protein n=1 Tax=Cladocopium goreaui TaxID=2562237 RepID=A0A9P1CEA9_9DINO|nr:unnamed protein product [Cladocopium goreaui]
MEAIRKCTVDEYFRYLERCSADCLRESQARPTAPLGAAVARGCEVLEQLCRGQEGGAAIGVEDPLRLRERLLMTYERPRFVRSSELQEACARIAEADAAQLFWDNFDDRAGEQEAAYREAAKRAGNAKPPVLALNLAADTGLFHSNRALKALSLLGFGVLTLGTNELVLHHANVKSIWGRLHLRCVEAGNELGNLFPTHTRHWWPIVEDIFMSSAIQSLLTSIDLTLRTSSEYTCISIDATLKVAMSIKGQASYRSSAAIRNEACFGDTEALRRVLTVRGCTRAVLAMQLIKGEEALEVAQALQRSMSTLGCAQVLYVMSDSPSSKLLRALQPVSPNLRGLALDPVHTAIVYEYAQWRRRTPGSKLLRELLNKVVQHDPEKAMASWGCLYDGIEAEPLTRQEEKWREQILNWTHPKAYAERVVGNLKPNLPVYTRVSFIEAIAAKGSGALLDVQMSFRVAGARDCAPCQKRAKREGFVAVSTTTTTTHTHYTTYTPLHSTPLHSTPPHSTPLHSTPLHPTPLHSTPLQQQLKLQLHYTTLRYATLH